MALEWSLISAAYRVFLIYMLLLVTEHSLVWICSVHNEIMKHCWILLQDTCMRVGAWEPVPPAYRWPPSPQGPGAVLP